VSVGNISLLFQTFFFGNFLAKQIWDFACTRSQLTTAVFALKLPIKRNGKGDLSVLHAQYWKCWYRGSEEKWIWIAWHWVHPSGGDNIERSLQYLFNECLWRESTECIVQWTVKVSFGSEWTHQSKSQSAKAPILMKNKQAGNERVSVSDGATERCIIIAEWKRGTKSTYVIWITVNCGKGRKL